MLRILIKDTKVTKLNSIEERIYPFFMYIDTIDHEGCDLQYKKLKGKFENHNFLLLVLTSVYYHSYYSSV